MVVELLLVVVDAALQVVVVDVDDGIGSSVVEDGSGIPPCPLASVVVE